MPRFIGKFEDLKTIRSESYDGKSRYLCPYCDSIYGKEPDQSGCVIFDKRKLSGYCFRCETRITHDGLPDLEYLRERILKKEGSMEGESKLLEISWLKSIFDNPEVLEYMHSRFIYNSTLERFNIKSCNIPSPGVVFINKIINENYTDFMQVRLIQNPKFKHVFLRDLIKKLCWIDLVGNQDLIICEGFIDGLSAFQHSKELDQRLNPLPLGGKTITNSQIQELNSFCSSFPEVNITVCMDGGFFEDTLKVASKIYQSCYNTNIKVMPMPFNRDLNEISTKEFLIQYNQCLQFEPSKIKYIRNKVYNKSRL